VIGVDTGGTFTDLVLVEEGELRVAKVPSRPRDPLGAIRAGLKRLGIDESAKVALVHGTTVALNALLTGRTARVALVVNEGFRDLIEIGRQDRPVIYALHPEKTSALVPRALRFEVPARVWPAEKGDGFETVREPKVKELRALVERVKKSRAESVAVCLLHSWADDRHEKRVAEALSKLKLPVTTSAELVPEHREFERFSTAVVNAALEPRMRRYIASLRGQLGAAKLSMLQSTGGTLTAERAAREPVRVLFSGPAGGVIGAARAAQESGFSSFCTLDMGGTSTDVAFHSTLSADERNPQRSLEPVHVAGHPLSVPSLDIHTIGCGGGSLATVDAGGILHVGPKSAGADPGPACYGKSDRPTVTDAHVLLGHVSEGAFLGGSLKLDHRAVELAFEKLAESLATTPEKAAAGVLEVARAAMRRAVGVMTLERGEDPEKLVLIAFGGAGGLHAAALAQSLRMPAALVPRHPGALSASGMTHAEPTRDLSRSVLVALEHISAAQRRKIHRELGSRARAELVAAGFPAASIVLEHTLDLRYRGQSFEQSLPESTQPCAAFHDAHERRYGYALREREVELVCLRTRARVAHSLPKPTSVRSRLLPKGAIREERRCIFDRPHQTGIIERGSLRPGHTFRGPALVEEYSGTTLVPPGWKARVTALGHLLLTRSTDGARRTRGRKRSASS
jgi:N-methylhydantoinase A